MPVIIKQESIAGGKALDANRINPESFGVGPERTS